MNFIRTIISASLALLIGIAVFNFWRCKTSRTSSEPLAIASVQEFDNYIKTATKPTIVQFHSGCPVCLKTGMVIRKTVAQHPETQLIEVDVNSVKELAQRYEITSLPTVLIFAPGEMEPQEKIIDPDAQKIEDGISKSL